MSEGFGFTGDIGAFFTQLGKSFSASGDGSLPGEVVRDIARAAVSAQGDKSLGESDLSANIAALRLADHWLDETTTLPAAGGKVTAWSRAEWVEQSLAGWLELIGPLAVNLGNSMESAFKEIEEGGQLPAEIDLGAHGGFSGFSGPLGAIVKQLGGALFAQQLGATIGTLAGKVVGANDITLPLTNVTALVPANVTEWGQDLGLSDDDIRLFLALRESAAARLVAHIPWLASRLKDSVSAYGSGLIINVSAIQEQAERVISAMGESDDPQALQDAIAGGIFTPAHTPEQEAALTSLETLLALIEGWVDVVVGQAMGDRVPSRLNLQETSRRRRATASPTQITFATLVGLEVSPRLAREAAHFWELATNEYGIAKRDEFWSHSELLPDASGIAEPTAFFRSINVPDDLSGLI